MLNKLLKISSLKLAYSASVLLCVVLFGNLLFLKSNQIVSSKKHVAVLIPGSVPFFDVQSRAILKAADELNIKITLLNAGWDPIIQIQQIHSALSLGIDAIAIAAVDNHALIVAPIILSKYKIPLITFTNAIGDNHHGLYENILTHIGRDEVEAGRLLAYEIERLRPHQETAILLIQGTAGTAPQRLRNIGFQEIVSTHPNWKVIRSIKVQGWNNETVEAEIQKIYNSGLNVDIIATQWAGAAVAAAYIVDKHKKKISIVSLEFNAALQKEMLKGTIASSTSYSIAEEGRRMVKTISKILKGEKANRFVPIKQKIIDLPSARKTQVEY